MKGIRLIGLVLMTSLALAPAASAAEQAASAAEKAAPAAGEKEAAPQKVFAEPQKEGTKAICPVMGNTFTIGKNTPQSVYKDQYVYFCCNGCKQKFDADPEKYLGAKR